MRTTGLGGLLRVLPCGGLLLLMALVASACNSAKEPDSGQPAAKTTDNASAAQEVTFSDEEIASCGVEVQPVAKAVLTPSLWVSGHVALDEYHLAMVSAPVAGVVKEIRVREGDEVKSGDVLAVLDSRELGEAQSDYLRKLSQLHAADPILDVSRKSYERGKQLMEQSGSFTLSELEQREIAFRTAEAAQLSAKADFDAAEHQMQLLGFDRAALDKLAKTQAVDSLCLMRAPLAGSVLARKLALGQFVGPDHDVLFEISDLGTLWVEADFPEEQAGIIKLGSDVDVSATLAPGEVTKGKVVFCVPQMDALSHTLQVRIEVKGAFPKLRPGMLVTTRVPMAESSEPVLAIPEGALVQFEGAPAVFVAGDEKGVFTLRYVRVAEAQDGMVRVLGGLADGDKIVVQGAFYLKAELAMKAPADE